MSAFALPIPPRPLTGIASQAYGTLRYRGGQKTGDGRRATGDELQMMEVVYRLFERPCSMRDIR
jgi:hypothetical protein